MAGSSVNVTAKASWSSESNVRRFHSATECLDYLGPAAYRPKPSSQGTIRHWHTGLFSRRWSRLCPKNMLTSSEKKQCSNDGWLLRSVTGDLTGTGPSRAKKGDFETEGPRPQKVTGTRMVALRLWKKLVI